MKVIFFGTPFFAAETLDYLISNKVEIIAVVTQTDKRNIISKVKAKVLEKIPLVRLFQPAKATDPSFIENLKKLNPELFVVVAYGKILRKQLLDIPAKGSINVHASLLPKYRGAAPIQRSIMDGEKETGITIMKMTPELDAGDIIEQQSTVIDDEMTYGGLEKELCEIAKPLLLKVIKEYETKEVKGISQNEDQVNYAHKITSEECKINFNNDAERIHNLVRALAPIPGARCLVEINDQKKQLKILKTQIVDKIDLRELGLSESVVPGEVLACSNKNFIITCKSKYLKVLTLQLEGKKVMPVEDFIRGIKGNIKIIFF